MIEPLLSDMHFGGKPMTKAQVKAMAKATAQMLLDKTNTILAACMGKDDQPVYLTREIKTKPCKTEQKGGKK